MPPVPIPGGVGFMAAQRAWPQAGQSRQTLPFPHSHARPRPPAVSWPRAALSSFPVLLGRPRSAQEAAGTRAVGLRLDPASTQELLAELPCEAPRDSLEGARADTQDSDGQQKAGQTHAERPRFP